MNTIPNAKYIVTPDQLFEICRSELAVPTDVFAADSTPIDGVHCFLINRVEIRDRMYAEKTTVLSILVNAMQTHEVSFMELPGLRYASTMDMFIDYVNGADWLKGIIW